MNIEVVKNITQQEFVDHYVAENKPVVVDGIPFESDKWKPDSIVKAIGELTTQVYGSLFDLENISSLDEYIEDYFNQDDEEYPEDVPYVRWYNQLKDIDFAWGDEAFEGVSSFWQKPDCVPDQNLLVPLSTKSSKNPVTDLFPYRGVLVSARGARTRMHRDPFCSDAIVAQFYGEKEALLYHPDRTEELTITEADDSFGGFIDVREDDLANASIEPTFRGNVKPGQMIYIPHGWLHDVICVSDSISVTWNFVHERGSREFIEYLKNDPTNDSEFEVLQYMMQRDQAGANLSPNEILSLVS